MNPSLIRQRLLDDQRPALQRLLAKHAIWDEQANRLIIDLSAFHTGLMPVSLPAWEELVGWQGPAPQLPNWPILNWPALPAVRRWRQSIPTWIRETLQRLPERQQLRLLYLSARYPQMLELLEKMPVLAWRIATGSPDEHTLTTLFHQPRTLMTAAVGWPQERAAVTVLQRLRLRNMDTMMIQQIETCLNDQNRLQPLTRLPRINSMALTLAAHFPQLIDTPLHHSLARQPCRPEQCRQMHALLQDTLALADWLHEDITPIHKARFLVEIEALYAKWLEKAVKQDSLWSRKQPQTINLGETPSPWQRLKTPQQLDNSVEMTGHAFFIEYAQGAELLLNEKRKLVVACFPDETIVARTSDNHLPTPEQQTEIVLLKAQLDRLRTNR